MSIIHSAAGLGYTTDPRWSVFGFLTRCLVALEERRTRGERLAELYNLDDRALIDIGIARGEIEYRIRELDCPADRMRS
jgi:uncharacterized protein YjiS (DUF1127 family)